LELNLEVFIKVMPKVVSKPDYKESANEGVAQVLFFEADDNDVCEISYKDRGGK
jgi:deoxycytidine triphosphate deaminase